jgi:hypothetical protein
MYPAGELDALAVRKNMLLLRIALHRQQCVVAGSRLAKPLAWADDIIARWRKISPIAKMVGLPLGLMLARKATKRLGGSLKLLRFAPLILQTARSFARRRA